MDDHLATAFIDLYAKRGSIDKAVELFSGLRRKDVVAYTTMILGRGINSGVSDAIKLYEEMINFIRNLNRIINCLQSCCLVEEGYDYFNPLKKYGLVLTTDHYILMVDLLGRAEQLVEARELIKSMPMQPHAGVWGAFSTCNLHKNVELGEIAAKHCFELEPDINSCLPLLAGIYSSAGKWVDTKKLSRKRYGQVVGWNVVD